MIAIDALYLTPNENGSAYAVINERVEHPGFKGHVGVRGRAAANLGSDCWQVWLQFLHYHARMRDRKSGEVFPTHGYKYSLLTGFAPQVDSMWRLHMGLADLCAGKGWSISQYVDLLPYFGLRYSEIRHKIETRYSGQLDLSMKNKVFGVGPQVGVEMLFRLWGGFGLFSRFAADLLYSKIYAHQSQDGARGKLNLLYLDRQVRPQFEAALGLNVQWCAFYGRAAGELYFFPGQNQLFCQESLSLSGLSLGLGLYF